MLGRIALRGAAAAIVLPLLVYAPHASARGFGATPAHAGPARWQFGRHGYSHRRHGYGRYRNGFAYLPLGYEFGDDAQVTTVPLAYPIYLGPRCVHSVETVVVPAELGGERVIRITRC